jgi:hypothetical protein
VGIICLTSENLNAEWILFEAGAMAKILDETPVCTFLLDVKPTDVRSPLAEFEATKADKEDTRRLVQTINNALGSDALSEKQLDSTFDKWWTELEEMLNEIPPAQTPAVRRSPDDMLEEVLELLRGLTRAERLASDPRVIELLKEIEQGAGKK